MAYTADEWLLTVRGSLGSTEEWNNSWCLFDLVGGQDIQDGADILSGLYEDWYGFASWISANAQVVGCSARNLLGGAPTEMNFWTGAGSSPDPLLPTQCAMRVSLTAAGGRNGGPFLSGFGVDCTEATDIVDACVSDFIGALNTFTTALTTGGWELRLHSPTDETTLSLIQGRIGERWDVIRKRANNIAEGYSMFSIA